MNISEITKVTVWPATVGYKDGKFIADKSKNKWQIAVFTKGGNMTLAAFVNGQDGDKALKAYTGIYKHSKAVVLAHEFCVEYAVKEAETTITKELAYCQSIVDAEKKKKEEKDERDAFNAAHPELAGMRKHAKHVEELQKIAIKSTNTGFKRFVVDISKKSNDMLAKLEADIAAEDPAQAELEEAMRAAS